MKQLVSEPLIATLALCLLFVSFLSGCAHYGGLTLESSDIVALNRQNEELEYVLGVGDKIAVKFFYKEKLNEEVTVRPDGKISLQLIGDVQAAGLTPDRLEEMITREYSGTNKTTGGTYAMNIGDKIAVKFFYKEKLNEEVTVRPDGKISLQLIGDVQAAGLTPDQMDSLLTEKFSEVMDSPEVAVIVMETRMPEVAVIVRDFAADKVYVGGAVARPGLIAINGMLRVLDAVIQRGGHLDTAEIKNVILIRYSGSSEPQTYSLNLKKIIRGEIPDVKLRPYDIVYLPRTSIAKVDLFVRQYFYNLLPNQVLFSFPYDLNPEVRVKD